MLYLYSSIFVIRRWRRNPSGPSRIFFFRSCQTQINVYGSNSFSYHHFYFLINEIYIPLTLCSIHCKENQNPKSERQYQYQSLSQSQPSWFGSLKIAQHGPSVHGWIDFLFYFSNYGSNPTLERL
jgi:hypothetical protein